MKSTVCLSDYNMLISCIVITFILSVLLSIPIVVFSAPLWLPGSLVLYLFLKVIGVWSKVEKRRWEVYEWLLFRSDKPRKYLWRKFFNFLVWMFPQPDWKSMNYGYALDTEQGRTIDLDPQDENERFSYQLYHFVATAMNQLANLEGLVVADIGSGRGGGLYYVCKYLKPESAIGVDYSRSQIAFCYRHYREENLRWIEGDATSLPLKSNSIDLLLCIQSSHCFPDLHGFLSEAERVLNPGGRLLLADFVYTSESEDIDLILTSTRLKVKQRIEITENVLLSLQLDSGRRMELIESYTPSYMFGIMSELGGVEGSNMYLSMICGDRIYLSYELVKY